MSCTNFPDNLIYSAQLCCPYFQYWHVIISASRSIVTWFTQKTVSFSFVDGDWKFCKEIGRAAIECEGADAERAMLQSDEVVDGPPYRSARTERLDEQFSARNCLISRVRAV